MDEKILLEPSPNDREYAMSSFSFGFCKDFQFAKLSNTIGWETVRCEMNLLSLFPRVSLFYLL